MNEVPKSIALRLQANADLDVMPRTKNIIPLDAMNLPRTITILVLSTVRHGNRVIHSNHNTVLGSRLYFAHRI